MCPAPHCGRAIACRWQALYSGSERRGTRRARPVHTVVQHPYSNGVLIYNPEAGSLRKRCAELIRQVTTELDQAGIAVTPCSTAGPGTATELARQAVQSGA